MATKHTLNIDSQEKGHEILPLYDFFIELQKNGFSVTPKQISDATKIIHEFSKHIENESELAIYLSPLFANNQEEQIQFNEIFNQHFCLVVKQPLVLETKPNTIKSHLRKNWWKYLIGLLLLLGLAAYIAYHTFIIISPSFDIVDKNSQSNSDHNDEAIQLKANDSLAVEIKMIPFFGVQNTEDIIYHVSYNWGDGSNTDINNIHQYTQEGIYNLQAYITFYKNRWWTYQDTVIQQINICNKESTLQIENSNANDSIFIGEKLKLKAIIIGEKPDSIAWYDDNQILSVGENLDTIFKNEGSYYFNCKAYYGDSLSACHRQQTIKIIVKDTTQFNITIQPSLGANAIAAEKKLKSFWLWLTGYLSLLTLALTIPFALLWKRAKKKLKQADSLHFKQYEELVKSFEGRKPPLEVPFQAKNYLAILEPNLQITARQMRKRMSFDETYLSIPRTIQKSIYCGGLFQPVLIQRTQQSEFLFLIDETNKNNQLVKLIQYLIEMLSKQNVLIDVYYFREGPNFCYNASEPNGVSLEKLSARHGNHILLLFGKADQLLYPHYPIFDQEYLRILSRWKNKAIITPSSFLDWGNKELSILLPQIPIVPMDLEGIAILIRSMLHLEGDIISGLKKVEQDFYSTANIDFEELEQLETYCNHIEWANVEINGVKENIFLQWLAAIAVYPKLRWELILSIGKGILDQYEKPSELNYTNLLRIARIKWISEGQMPDYIRLDLLKLLKPKNEVVARETILSLLSEINHLDLNPTHFAYEEKEIQRVTNEFNLYAYDPIKYERYKASKATFEKLWRENKMLDSPSKVYLKNPGVEWDNLIQQKDDDHITDNETMPLEKYFTKEEETRKPLSKKYFYLSLISALLFFSSLIALIFFLVIKSNNSNKFPRFFERKTVEKNISFSLNDSSLIFDNKPIKCFIDTIAFDLNHGAKETKPLLINDSSKSLVMVAGEKTILDTNMVFEFDAYDILLNQPTKAINDSIIQVTLLNSNGCYLSDLLRKKILEINAKIQIKDSVVLAKIQRDPNSMKAPPCRNAISFGSSVDLVLQQKMMKTLNQFGEELKIVSPSDFPIENNEIQIYQKNWNPIMPDSVNTYNVRIFLSDECESSGKVYQNLLEQESKADRSFKLGKVNIKAIGTSNRKGVNAIACVNRITASKNVDQEFVNQVIAKFKKSGYMLEQKKKIEIKKSDDEVIIYYNPESCDPSVNISLNQGKNTLTVKPLDKVNISGTYSLSNIICPDCIQQLIIGIGSKPLDCIYDGVPSICPIMTKGSIDIEMKAPSQPGIYDFYLNSLYQFGCNISDYKGASGRLAKKIGTLIVKADQIESDKTDTTTIIYDYRKDKNSMTQSVNQSTKILAVKFRVSSGTAYSWSLKGNSKTSVLNFIDKENESFANQKGVPGGSIYEVHYFKVLGIGKQRLVFEYYPGFSNLDKNNEKNNSTKMINNELFTLDINVLRNAINKNLDEKLRTTR